MNKLLINLGLMGLFTPSLALASDHTILHITHSTGSFIFLGLLLLASFAMIILDIGDNFNTFGSFLTIVIGFLLLSFNIAIGVVIIGLGISTIMIRR